VEEEVHQEEGGAHLLSVAVLPLGEVTGADPRLAEEHLLSVAVLLLEEVMDADPLPDVVQVAAALVLLVVLVHPAVLVLVLLTLESVPLHQNDAELAHRLLPPNQNLVLTVPLPGSLDHVLRAAHRPQNLKRAAYAVTL